MLTEYKVTEFFVVVEKSVTFSSRFLFKSVAEIEEKLGIECFEGAMA